MKKFVLCAGSFFVVFLFIVGSFRPVVGFQVSGSSSRLGLESVVDGREVLFQTILDLVNNKEIQGALLPERKGDGPIVVTRRDLEMAYHLAPLLMKRMDESRHDAVLKNSEVSDEVVRGKLSMVIEENMVLSGDLTKLSSHVIPCNCGQSWWWYPGMICICGVLGAFALGLYFVGTLCNSTYTQLLHYFSTYFWIGGFLLVIGICFFLICAVSAFLLYEFCSPPPYPPEGV